MIYKFTLSISGDSFDPIKIENSLKGDFQIISSFGPRDEMLDLDDQPYGNGETYGFGSISLWHPKRFASDQQVREYENSFIEFIQCNHRLFIENGGQNFEIFMEIYYDGNQCNFEIFNNLSLKKLSEFNVSLPISVYTLKEDELDEWENEIHLKWE